MNILFATAEAHPFAKVGGLADVLGSLPEALRRLGLDARVVMPGYGFINHDKHHISFLFSYNFTHREGTSSISVYTTVHQGVPFYFLQGWPYFGQDSSVYTEWNWDAPRFIFFNLAVMAFFRELRAHVGWSPDALHVNDWHTSLLPFLVDRSRERGEWTPATTFLSIHNLAYQGDHVGGWLFTAGVDGRQHPDLVYQDLTDNMLAIGIAYSDVIITVSPRYAIEIQYPYMGYGLDGLIRTRVADLYGILNGIDAEGWNPATDPALVANFDDKTVGEKRVLNKRHLQERAGLPIRDEVPIIGMVSRLVWQKGIDLAIPALRRVLVESDVQLITLGTGDPDLEFGLWRLAQDFRWKARAYLHYDDALAQHIYAGCDLFLMPSHFEPCGMGQMLAMRYGALPLVRETGGLADTVENYDGGQGEHGTGFVFAWEEADAVYGTLNWAIDTYRARPEAWLKMQRRAMRRDFSWQQSAARYAELYQKAVEQRQQEESLEG
jgi:starch synthase